MSEARSRPPHGPVLRGDIVDDERVIGFAYVSDALGDRLLVEGDEDLAQPPDRPLPSGGAGVERHGEPPLTGARRVEQAPPHVRMSVLSRIEELGDGGRAIWRLLRALQAQGHEVWVAGGTVRDLLADGPAATDGDLDCTGTAGPGRLTALHRRQRRRDGAGDFEPNVSPRLVWSLAPPGTRQRIFEYRPLALDGFRFPAFGGDLVHDSATRDLTVNALYYDLVHDEIVDPLGVGLAHLDAVPRKLVVLDRGKDPVVSAGIVLRCLKFWRRWRHVDLLAVQDWVRELPDDLPALVPEAGWGLLGALRQRCGLTGMERDAELALAGNLGPAAHALVLELQERAAGVP